jgi:hypothetical protein
MVFSPYPSNRAIIQLWAFCELWISSEKISPVSQRIALVSAFQVWGFAVFYAQLLRFFPLSVFTSMSACMYV